MSRSYALLLLCATLLIGCDTGPTANNKARDAAVKARAEGTAEATTALAKGVLLIKEYPPLPAPAEHGEYITLLKEKCNCDYEVVDAPKYTVEMRELVEGWNNVMKAEIRGRFGATIFDDLHTEARKRWEASAKLKEKE